MKGFLKILIIIPNLPSIIIYSYIIIRKEIKKAAMNGSDINKDKEEEIIDELAKKLFLSHSGVLNYLWAIFCYCWLIYKLLY